MNNEFNKMGSVTNNESFSRVQILTEGGAPFNNAVKVIPPGTAMNSSDCACLVIHAFGESNHKFIIPFQYEDNLPDQFEDGDSGLYDFETKTHIIKINKDGITIESSNVTVDRGDGNGPRPVALVGDVTSDGATIVGAT